MPIATSGYFQTMGVRGERRVTAHQIRKLVGANVTRLMSDKEISARTLAAKAKVDRRTIDRLRRGEYAPNLDTVGHIADALGAAAQELFMAHPALTGKGEELIHGRSLKVAPRTKARADNK